MKAGDMPHSTPLLVNGELQFNQQVAHGQWTEDLSGLTSTPVAALDDDISQEPKAKFEGLENNSI